MCSACWLCLQWPRSFYPTIWPRPVLVTRMACDTLQALSAFARLAVVPDSAAAADALNVAAEQSDDESPSPSIHAMRRSESHSANRGQVRSHDKDCAREFDLRALQGRVL